MVHHRSRLPALIILVALLAFGSGMVLARRGNANDARLHDLTRLQADATAPTAHADAWDRYGQALQAAGRLPDAIIAFDQALKLNTYDRDARLGGASCRARLGHAQSFYDFMLATNRVDPKTSQAIFSRPEAMPYLGEPRFQTLKFEADSGAAD